MVHTNSSVYWSPLKPRINIYSFTDTTYSSPLFTYNAFTDAAGTPDRPVGLSFESQTTTAGTFSLEIDDSGDSIDPDAFLRGNRVVIECSKDGSTWQTAFKGLVRSAKQKIFAQNNRTLTLEGYSYLIRLSERILSTRKQSKLLAVGGDFDRTDSTMFSDNLINDLLTNDANYLYTTDDTQLYSVFKTANVTSSPIDDWIPRIDVALDSLNDGINSVLEFTNSLLTVDFSNDQLVLFNPDRLPTTGGSNAFLLTDVMTQSADDANYTMYPTTDYTFQISYDYPDAGNRLIGSIGTAQCPNIEIPGTPGTAGDPDNLLTFPLTTSGTFALTDSGPTPLGIGALMKVISVPVTKVRLGGATVGTPTTHNNEINLSMFNWTGQLSGTNLGIGSQVGSNYKMYINGVSGTALPTAASNVYTAAYKWETPSSFSFSPTINKWYWFTVYPNANINQVYRTDTLTVGWSKVPNDKRYFAMYWGGSVWYVYSHVEQAGSDPAVSMDFGPPGSAGTPGTPATQIPPCGGLPETEDADPLLMVASDCNTAKRIGMVEQAITNMPIHVKNFGTMNEYLFNKLYVTARPRFNFDFPSVTVPGIMPKAGDICCHISRKSGVGVRRGAVQTGVISAVNYTFGQDNDSVLGLRKLAIGTTGILRGSY